MGRALAAIKKDGWRRTLWRTALKTINRVGVFKILVGVWVETPDRSFCQCDKRFTTAFLSETAIRRFALDPENALSSEFVEEALGKGDACYGITDGPVLASYGWYSTQPTRIDPPDLFLEFDKDYVYMYKGFTHPTYRGKRLHAVGMTLALAHYRSEGFKGIVSYIESDNFESLKSSYRMGYLRFGSICLGQVFGRTLSYATTGCKKFGFSVIRPPSASIAVCARSQQS